VSPIPVAEGDDRRVPGALNRLLLRDLEGWLPDDLLVKVDRMTMSTSLEARVPYLDHQFVEWTLGLSTANKVGMLDGANKRLLRRAAATMLPGDLAARPKQGFKPPIDAWLRGRLRDLSHDALLSASARLRNRIDGVAVVRLLRDHDRGRPNGHRIWALLVCELWSRQYGVV
jgi:asparagine synthase (glutamine-hydrolysing)